MRKAFRDSEAVGNGYPPTHSPGRLRMPMTLEEAIEHFAAQGFKGKAARKLAERYVSEHRVMVPPGVVVVIKR